MATDVGLYDDIRPFNDDEIASVVERLVNDKEFITAIAHFQFPRLIKNFSWVIFPMIRILLRRKCRNITSVSEIQHEVIAYMEKMIATTTTQVTFNGTEKLDKDKNYLFISNHRDIAMDPAFVNWALHHHGLDTVRIAIGDNLLKKPFVADLMRLNKSFIVKRSAKGVREMIAAFKSLSGYISHSIKAEHQSIWIAQKEGRAKDGNDQTDPAILKMMYMHGKGEKISFPEYMKSLNIVPVAISYEFDPNDAAKANEICQLATAGEYNKAEFEDIDSIVQGIVGFKGHVNVTFGDVITDDITDDIADANELALRIDQVIDNNYHLHSTNLLAAEQLHATAEYKQAASSVTASQRAKFAAHLQTIPTELHATVLAGYAKSVEKQLTIDA
ncbi:1-acyl-sn-glycerol-3-phosphate acyltransferase [Moritella sp. Urea-trap-13]|uniref:1-acyl-sn-glycerol-3-phosphate acyltransferase n=1 Tax=Moritella sp. Urea-trap-13 TaxID=2058327 RepID=UPI000C32F9B3|nr:1-acyl-sn-glycerol-3-phosphate acyltransferase [Moritella sp. Urea-trap-13]PKH07622.1 acyltransferase [Moritella sp. Urea-trap-13]